MAGRYALNSNNSGKPIFIMMMTVSRPANTLGISKYRAASRTSPRRRALAHPRMTVTAAADAGRAALPTADVEAVDTLFSTGVAKAVADLVRVVTIAVPTGTGSSIRSPPPGE